MKKIATSEIYFERVTKQENLNLYIRPPQTSLILLFDRGEWLDLEMDQFEKRFVEMFCEQWNSDIGWPTGGSKGINPWGSKLFQFHAVFGKFGEIVCWCPPSSEGWRPTSGKSWIRHWVDLMYFPVLMKFINEKNFLFRALAWLKSPNFRKSSKDSYLIWEMSVYMLLPSE